MATAAPTVAISPIVGGAALRGPAAQMMRSLGGIPSAAGISSYFSERYPGLIDILVIDNQDASGSDAAGAAGLRVAITNTLIASADERRRLAQEILELAGGV